jgi:hypothetical protein
VIVRFLSGLPYTPIDPSLTIPLPPNSARLPWTNTIDLLIRRHCSWQGRGQPLLRRAQPAGPAEPVVGAAGDRDAVRLPGNHRQRRAVGLRRQSTADPVRITPLSFLRRLNQDGLVSGPDELLPLYRSAAKDYFWPVFYYGPPRLMRFGIEVFF